MRASVTSVWNSRMLAGSRGGLSRGRLCAAEGRGEDADGEGDRDRDDGWG